MKGKHKFVYISNNNQEVSCLFTFLQPVLDGKDLDIEVDSTADSDSEEYFDEDDEDDDPFANIPIKVISGSADFFFRQIEFF